MQTDRRAFLGGGAAIGATALLPGGAIAAASTDVGPLYDRLVQAQLRRSPEGATQLGLDKGANADLRARLSDQSLAAVARNREAARQEYAELGRVDRAGLSPDDQVAYDAVLYTRRSAVALGQFPYGGAGYGPSPYVVSQQTGAYQDVPDFLDTKHKIETAGDADAYLQRLAAFARQLDDQTERMRHDAGLGVVPPDYILDLTLDQMSRTAAPADQALVVTSLSRRAVAKGLGDSYGAKAAALYTAQVLPALQRQLAYTRELRRTAKHDAGVWRLPQGDAFYAAALKATTTSSMSPDEVHRFGLDQAAARR